MRLSLQQGHLTDRHTETAPVMRGGKTTDSMGDGAPGNRHPDDDKVTGSFWDPQYLHEGGPAEKASLVGRASLDSNL